MADCWGCGSPSGGALYAALAEKIWVQGSRFDANYGWYGGAVRVNDGVPFTIRQSTFSDNGAGYGGALKIVNADIAESAFTGNQVTNRGGAIDAGLYNLSGSLVLSGVQFVGNVAVQPWGGGGGALSTVGSFDAQNVLFADNWSPGGSIVQFDQGFTRTLRHVTIARSQPDPGAAVRVSAGALNITNTLVASHAVGISVTGGIAAAVSADYSLFAGGAAFDAPGGGMNFGTHNLLGQDPRFVNSAAGDYHLRAGSPAIGAGVNAGVAFDLDGRPRLTRFDIGAYQFWARVLLPAVMR